MHWTKSTSFNDFRATSQKTFWDSANEGHAYYPNPQGKGGGIHRSDVSPQGNANFAWVQHIIHQVAPNGIVGFFLANFNISSNHSGEYRDLPRPLRGRPRGLHVLSR